MESKTNVQLAIGEVLAHYLGVEDTYRHRPKEVSHGQPIATSDCILKWYELFSTGSPIPKEIGALARTTLENGRLSVNGLGAVVLHRCGRDFYFLIVTTWRNENELWEVVWYKDGNSMSAFAEFPCNDFQRPTFCVWELVPIWHEKQAWERFLRSDRNVASTEFWLADLYSGAA